MTHRILPHGIVFVNIRSDATRSAFQQALATVQPNLTVTPLPCSIAAAGIKHWESTKGAVPEQPVNEKFEFYVTDSSIASDPSVVYALYTKKIPVLALVADDDAAQSNPIGEHPLLTVVTTVDANDDNDGSVAQHVVDAFFKFPTTRGRVIVIEGGDGAGKQTQTALLLKRLRDDMGLKAATLDFPHDAARYGVLIREVLAGHKGNLRDVSPLVFGSLYSLNRHDLKPEIDFYMLRGINIVFDRWTSANYGHQASKLATDEERDAAINALRTFEVRWLGLPEADVVLYLDLPPAAAMAAMLKDATRKELDLHEKAGIEYKENVRRAFLWCCTRFGESWSHIKCWDDGKDERVPREAVHESVWGAVKHLFGAQ